MKETEMGFVPEENHYRLHFEDPKLAGLEVTVAEVTTGELLTLAELASDLGDDAKGLANAPKVKQLFEMLAGSVVEWNIEDRNGEVVPAGLDGVKAQSFKLILKIVKAWISAMAEVDSPLPEGSNSGVSALAQSLPMESLSPSPGS